MQCFPRRVALGTLTLAITLGLILQREMPALAAHMGTRGTRQTTNETLVYSFAGSPRDGALPAAALLAVNGSFYGTTALGGASNSGGVFKLTPSGGGYTESVLWSFQGGSDGLYPECDMIINKNGALYATTYQGGAYGNGTAFKLVPSGGGYTEKILYSFKGGGDGANPEAGLLADVSKKGTFYGTTRNGGARGLGTVFRLAPSRNGYTERTLYSFKGGSDGATPIGDLIADGTGALYGTAAFGAQGTSTSACFQGQCGAVFKLTPSANGYIESVLYRFRGGTDGYAPFGALLADATGALYGVTVFGGSTGPTGWGTVFKLTPSGSRYTEAVIFRFDGINTGGNPNGPLIADSSGTLYGTTVQGRFDNCPSGCGTVFELQPSGDGYIETTLYGFAGPGSDGENPSGGLVADGSGSLYGMTTWGGAGPCGNGYGWYGCGTVFKITP